MREFDFATVPIVDIVNDIIIDGATKNASDIHFDPAENYLKIRMRIDGELRDYAIVENKYKRNLILMVKIWICVLQPFLLVLVKKLLSVF